MTKTTSPYGTLLYGGLGAVLLSLGGCQYSKLPAPCTKETSITDLVGIWEPTSETIADMKEAGYKISTHRLTLRSDGTFSTLNMPDCVFSGDTGGWAYSHGKFKSGDGKWQIIKFLHEGRTVWDVDFSFKTKGIGRMPSGPGPALVWQNNSYILRFGFGDADFGEAANFRKR